MKKLLAEGYTLIEILIVISIIVILSAISLGSFGYLQSQARDQERDVDTEAIARATERMYINKSVSPDPTPYPYPTYPATGDVTRIYSASNFKKIGLDAELLYSPRNNAGAAISASTSLVAATNNNETTAAVTPRPGSTAGGISDVYVYQPFTESGSLCTSSAPDPCVRFNLFYKKELGAGEIVKITSTNQR